MTVESGEGFRHCDNTRVDYVGTLILHSNEVDNRYNIYVGTKKTK